MVLPDVQATGAAVEDDQSRYVEMCRQMYGYEKIEIAVRQLEDWAACVVGVVAAEGGVDVTGLGRAGARLQSSDNVLAFGAVDRLSRVLVCRGLIAIVACWRADVLASRERAVVLREEPLLTKKMKRKLRVRAMALARMIGRARLVAARQWLYRGSMDKWTMAVFRRRFARAEALVAAAVPADDLLCRRVWLRLVGRFWWWKSGSEAVVGDVSKAKERRKSGEGAGDAVKYDWSCTQCGWGGQLVQAGRAYCGKCEWQCHRWCDTALMVKAADEQLVARLAQHRLLDRRVPAGVRRKMLVQLERLQGSQVELQDSNWRKEVRQTGGSGSGAAAGGQWQPPEPRAKRVVSDSGAFQLFSMWSDHIDKVGRFEQVLPCAVQRRVRQHAA